MLLVKYVARLWNTSMYKMKYLIGNILKMKKKIEQIWKDREYDSIWNIA